MKMINKNTEKDKSTEKDKKDKKDTIYNVREVHFVPTELKMGTLWANEQL